MDIKLKFAEVIKELRNDRSYQEFADLIGVTRPTIISWENADYKPKRESLELIAKLRGETLDEFLGYLEGRTEITPMERLKQQISGLSNQQIAELLRMLANRLDQS